MPRARFGEWVAEIVEHCTDTDVVPKPAWRERKEAYIASIVHKPVAALEVSLADKTHNAGSIVVDLAIHGDALWSRFTGGRDGSLWYYRGLVTAFRNTIGGAGTERFAKLIDEMGQAAAK